MHKTLPISVAAVFLLSAGAACAQTGPGNSNGYSRPLGVDAAPHDSASAPTDRDNLANGVANANTDRSAAAARANAAYAVPATPSELIVGTAVNDLRGVPLGTIEAVDADGVVMFNGTARIKVPRDAFGHNRKGLMLDVTKKQFDKMVVDANAKP